MSEPLTARVANATPKSKGASTEYQILAKVEASMIDVGSLSAEYWMPLETISARSANEAIREAAANAAGVFIAVPARSWKPVTVKVEQTTRITLT